MAASSMHSSCTDLTESGIAHIMGLNERELAEEIATEVLGEGETSGEMNQEIGSGENIGENAPCKGESDDDTHIHGEQIDKTKEDHTPLPQLIPRKVRSQLKKASGNPIFIPINKSTSLRTFNPPSIRTPFTQRKRKAVETALLILAKAKRGRSSATPSITSPQSIDLLHKDNIDLESHTSKGKAKSPLKTSKVKQIDERGLSCPFKSFKLGDETTCSKGEKESLSDSVSRGSHDAEEDIVNYIYFKDNIIDLDMERLTQFKQRVVLRGRVVTDFGGSNMDDLMVKVATQGWSNLFSKGITEGRYATQKLLNST
ncbi:hypothetical protein HAX54_002336 [Datura stramonium]|uniref:Uncharacterized protein n=1 Tax=Datura stramonium TaxID=4076 RepID=A0ABS8WVS5_DATST|nr:hypothetical protein [Datura stramonium]